MQDNIVLSSWPQGLARVHTVRLMNVEQCQAAADPQTKPPDLGCESACRLLQPPSTFTINLLLVAFVKSVDLKHEYAGWESLVLENPRKTPDVLLVELYCEKCVDWAASKTVFLFLEYVQHLISA